MIIPDWVINGYFEGVPKNQKNVLWYCMTIADDQHFCMLEPLVAAKRLDISVRDVSYSIQQLTYMFLVKPTEITWDFAHVHSRPFWEHFKDECKYQNAQEIEIFTFNDELNFRYQMLLATKIVRKEYQRVQDYENGKY
tara:strand:+ start:1427 stop:1840 length:414 start_codon:yes stop_codon:yes gene_type:complete